MKLKLFEVDFEEHWFSLKVPEEEFNKMRFCATEITIDSTPLTGKIDNVLNSQYCQHHIKGRQCIWGLRGLCGDFTCKTRPELRNMT